ncbi:Protein BREAST CANCER SUSCEPTIBILITY 1-like protein [Paramicrosporidium saccamoebae]|uniref:RING-type E3 ubiquitin transferase BRCA1 n=1 Tax=Paramicrosporidium saccamoebae TaxID=1246581 RepID=A0A2H9TH45_9FUNG|nr:Protein BREAST CANCER SUSCEPTIBILITY 1-like protein [Paramicrosporidium saccamoebae]
MTPCHHAFCKNCLERMLRIAQKTDAPCPVCKTRITRRSIREAGDLGEIVTVFGVLAEEYSSKSGHQWDDIEGTGEKENVHDFGSTPNTQEVARLRVVDAQLEKDLAQLDALIELAQTDKVDPPGLDASAQNDLPILSVPVQNNASTMMDYTQLLSSSNTQTLLDQIQFLSSSNSQILADYPPSRVFSAPDTQALIDQIQFPSSPDDLFARPATQQWSESRSMVLCTSLIKGPALGVVGEFADLFGLRISQQFDEDVTHIITPTKNQVAKRTLKYLRGVLRGCWLVSSEWVDICLQEGRLLDEKPFEVTGDEYFPDEDGPRRGRTSKTNGESPLLAGYSFYLYGAFSAPNIDDLQALIMDAGGELIGNIEELASQRRGKVTVLCDPKSQADFEKDEGVITKFKPLLSSMWLPAYRQYNSDNKDRTIGKSLIVFIGAIMNTNLKQLWQDRHRGRLHDPSSWDQGETVSLTYVSSSAGATGWAQLARFCALFPATQHPFSTDQLTRYNNQYEVISCMVDEGMGTVTEEIVISALHQERLDYLVPGVEAQHIVVAKYSASMLLEQVRVYWDQATLFKQLGVFHMAFHNLIRVAGNSVTFENELDTLPIVDGMRIARRLVHPTAQNCNLIVTLEALEYKPVQARTVKLSPKMAHELPVLNMPSRHIPQLKSSIFAPEEEVTRVQPRHSASMASHLVLGDGSGEQLQPSLHVPEPSIFEKEAKPLRPSITLDPHRNESRVFKEPSGPFQPDIPLTERSRFESKIFADSPMKIDTAPRQQALQHRSSVFAPEEEEPVVLQKAAVAECPFSTDSNIPVVMQQPKKPVRSDSHFRGSGFSFADEDAPQASFSGRRPDPRVNRSSINFSEDEPRVTAKTTMANRNQSQLQLGDDATAEPIFPSSRVLQPPGGKTSIFLE